MKYLEFIHKINNRNSNDKLILEYLIQIIFEDKEIETKYADIIYKIEEFRLKNILTGLKKRKVEKEIEDKLNNKCKNINNLEEVCDILSKYYDKSIIDKLDCNELEHLIKYEKDKLAKLAENPIDIKEEPGLINTPEYELLCKNLKKEDIENNIIDFKKDFKNKMDKDVKELFMNIKKIFIELDMKTCPIVLKNLKNEVNELFSKYTNMEGVDKLNICTGLLIHKSFKHVYNSQHNALENKCKIGDERSVKEIINILIAGFSKNSDNNIINGKDSYFKNRGLTMDDKFVDEILENLKNDNSISIIELYHYNYLILNLASFLISD